MGWGVDLSVVVEVDLDKDTTASVVEGSALESEAILKVALEVRLLRREDKLMDFHDRGLKGAMMVRGTARALEEDIQMRAT